MKRPLGIVEVFQTTQTHWGEARRGIAEWYADSKVIRAMIGSFIPYIGPIIDATLALPGTHSKEQRLNAFLLALFRSIKAIDKRADAIETVQSERFQDCLNTAINSSLNSRSRQKTMMNAMILANIINVRNTGNYRPEEYLLALAELSSTETLVLTKLFGYPFAGQNDELSEILSSDYGIDRDDMTFILRRLERTGFVNELISTEYSFTGQNFCASMALNRLIEYLRLHPYASLIDFKNWSDG